MLVELFGGPLDGTISSTAPSHLPVFLIVKSHSEEPIYRRGCCTNCLGKKSCVPYVFVGYENRFEAELKQVYEEGHKCGTVARHAELRKDDAARYRDERAS